MNAPKYHANSLCTGSYLDDNLYHHVQITATRQQLALILDGNLVLKQTTGKELFMNQTWEELHFDISSGGYNSKAENKDIRGCMSHFIANGHSLDISESGGNKSCETKNGLMSFTNVSS